MIYVNHQPGNCTKYDIYLNHLEDDIWLVSVPNFGVCFIVSSDSCLHYGYVESKCNTHTNVGEVDASEIAKVVAREIGAGYRGCTDSNGRYVKQE